MGVGSVRSPSEEGADSERENSDEESWLYITTHCLWLHGQVEAPHAPESLKRVEDPVVSNNASVLRLWIRHSCGAKCLRRWRLVDTPAPFCQQNQIDRDLSKRADTDYAHESCNAFVRTLSFPTCSDAP